MPFKVSSFSAEISQSGIAHPAFFECRILKAPKIVAPMMNNGMAFRIEQVNLPGRTLTTLDQNYHGPVRRIPYRFTHQPVSFTVILSKDMREREVFMKWQDHFIGHTRTNYGGEMDAPFDTMYYDDAIGTVDIIQYSYPLPNSDKKDYFESYNIRLIEAYPTAVNDIQMSWGDEGYAKLQVEMSFRYAQEAQSTFLNSTQATSAKTNRDLEFMNKLRPDQIPPY